MIAASIRCKEICILASLCQMSAAFSEVLCGHSDAAASLAYSTKRLNCSGLEVIEKCCHTPGSVCQSGGKFSRNESTAVWYDKNWIILS